MDLENIYTHQSLDDMEKNADKSNDKIILMHCQRHGTRCKDQLAEINRNFKISAFYHQNKEYEKSAEALSKAFSLTYELQEKTCAKCADMFRSTIIQSLENIHTELHNMSTGFFKTKRFKSTYVLVENVLNDLKKESNLN